eukprot:gb/GEZN01000753.1/.p1 GENE.gb/GEZN01000753.1/~~gb/GEZN01000753.1/.p1  ORF type:complete len:1195 (+),score=219.75 gb/GEZN01000753.1/:52-3636(+)
MTSWPSAHLISLLLFFLPGCLPPVLTLPVHHAQDGMLATGQQWALQPEDLQRAQQPDDYPDIQESVGSDNTLLIEADEKVNLEASTVQLGLELEENPQEQVSVPSVTPSPVVLPPSPSLSLSPASSQPSLSAIPSAAILVDTSRARYGAVYLTDQYGDPSCIFQDSEKVFLHAGLSSLGNPSNLAALPDGEYFFAVVDPAGPTLLSTDPLSCRRFHVQGHTIVAVPPPAAPPYSLLATNATVEDDPANQPLTEPAETPPSPYPPPGCPNREYRPAQTVFPEDRLLQLFPFFQAGGSSHAAVYKILVTSALSPAQQPADTAPNDGDDTVLTNLAPPPPFVALFEAQAQATVAQEQRAAKAQQHQSTLSIIGDAIMSRFSSHAFLKQQLDNEGVFEGFTGFGPGSGLAGLVTASNFQVLYPGEPATSVSYVSRVEVFAFHDANMDGQWENKDIQPTENQTDQTPNEAEQQIPGWPFVLTSPPPLLMPHVLFSRGHRQVPRRRQQQAQQQQQHQQNQQKQQQHQQQQQQQQQQAPVTPPLLPKQQQHLPPRRQEEQQQKQQSLGKGQENHVWLRQLRQTQHSLNPRGSQDSPSLIETGSEVQTTTGMLGLGMVVESGSWSVRVGFPPKGRSGWGSPASLEGVSVSQVRVDTVSEGVLSYGQAENLWALSKQKGGGMLGGGKGPGHAPEFGFIAPDPRTTELREGHTQRLVVGLVSTRTAEVCVLFRSNGEDTPDLDRLVFVKGKTLQGDPVTLPGLTVSGCARISGIPPGSYSVAIQIQKGLQRILQPTSTLDSEITAAFDCEPETGLCVSTHIFSVSSVLPVWPPQRPEGTPTASNVDILPTSKESAMDRTETGSVLSFVHRQTIVVTCVLRLRACLKSHSSEARPGLPLTLVPANRKVARSILTQIFSQVHDELSAEEVEGVRQTGGTEAQGHPHEHNNDGEPHEILRGVTGGDGCFEFDNVQAGLQYKLHVLEGCPEAERAGPASFNNSDLSESPLTHHPEWRGWYVLPGSIQDKPLVLSCDSVLREVTVQLGSYWGCDMNWWGANSCRWQGFLPTQDFFLVFAIAANPKDPTRESKSLLEALQGGHTARDRLMQQATAALLNAAYSVLVDDPEQKHAWVSSLFSPHLLLRKVSEAWTYPEADILALTDLLEAYNSNTWNGAASCGLASCIEGIRKQKEEQVVGSLSVMMKQLQ